MSDKINIAQMSGKYTNSLYDVLTDKEKQAIFDLSKTYTVRYTENELGVSLKLYYNPKIFMYRKTNKLQSLTNKIYMNDIIYCSSSENIDIRSVTIPTINYLKYDNHYFDYVNLPMIENINNLMIARGKRSIIIKDKEMYERYLNIHPKYLYNHEYINDELEILHEKYILDSCDFNKESKFWVNLNRHFDNVYIMKIYDTNNKSRFPLTKNIIDIMDDIKIIKCKYYPSCLGDMDIRISKIQKKLFYFGNEMDIHIKYIVEKDSNSNKYFQKTF